MQTILQSSLFFVGGVAYWELNEAENEHVSHDWRLAADSTSAHEHVDIFTRAAIFLSTFPPYTYTERYWCECLLTFWLRNFTSASAFRWFISTVHRSLQITLWDLLNSKTSVQGPFLLDGIPHRRVKARIAQELPNSQITSGYCYCGSCGHDFTKLWSDPFEMMRIFSKFKSCLTASPVMFKWYYWWQIHIKTLGERFRNSLQVTGQRILCTAVASSATCLPVTVSSGCDRSGRAAACFWV